MSDSSRPHGMQPTRPLRPWELPDKSTGVGCIAFSIVILESYKPKFLIKIGKIYSQQNINELNPVVHIQGKMSD